MKKNIKKGMITVCDGCFCNAGNDYGPYCNLGYNNYEGNFKKLGGIRYTRNVIGKDYFSYWHTWSDSCGLVSIEYKEDCEVKTFIPKRIFIE